MLLQVTGSEGCLVVGCCEIVCYGGYCSKAPFQMSFQSDICNHKIFKVLFHLHCYGNTKDRSEVEES